MKNQKKSCQKYKKDIKLSYKNSFWLVTPAVVTLILICFSYFTLTSFGNFTNTLDPHLKSESEKSPAEIIVPNLINLNFEKMKQTFNETGEFKLLLLDKQFSDTVEKGYILSHKPEKGSLVQRGVIIASTVSLGPKSRSQPVVSGLNLSEACLNLNIEGFIPIKTQQHSNTVSKDIVIGYEDHSAGETLDYGSEVKIIVSLGPDS
ncbi:MAG: hypothetical protein RUMPE_00597 [Eubacteriales bacterium SKADARSKE-1]|nr:hypothetical protein [Eubacteriales bacterium SKADARSKE-1]